MNREQAIERASIRDLLSEMTDYCDLADDNQRGTLSTALVREYCAWIEAKLPPRSLLRPAGSRPTVCYCPPGKCSAPKPDWCIKKGPRSSRTDI